MFNLFVVGAGFSRHAGLPLGGELASEVIQKSKDIVFKGQRGILYDNILSRDLERFMGYKKDTQGITLSEEGIDLEEFITFLDIEHFLGFKGSDIYSEEADRSQQIVKNLIALIILERQKNISEEQRKPYDDFASRLKPHDFVITFNYDTILEESLDRVGVPYRLVSDRYESVSAFGGSGVLQQDEKEVVILKVHGSIDWFDIEPWNRSEAFWARQPEPRHRNYHPIFSNLDVFNPLPIISEPFLENSQLRRVRRVTNLEEYFRVTDYVLQAPLMLAPSHQKLLYSNPLKEFWRGIKSAGGLSQILGIIGFSLPAHDQHAVQALYEIIGNFQYVDSGELFKKEPLRFVDWCPSEESRCSLKERYCFADWERTELKPDGFDLDAVNFIFGR